MLILLVFNLYRFINVWAKADFCFIFFKIGYECVYVGIPPINKIELQAVVDI